MIQVPDKELLWWQRGVVYQIYPRSFKDATGNGVGDLMGVIEKLDYLNDGTPDSLGIDIVWLSPIFPSPMADFGYDVADYCDVDPLFGDLETLDRLVLEAHQRGVRIILDYVPNHSSDRHPWFIESRSSRDNPKRDWYIWRDARPDGSPPNNWGSYFGGPAWTWDEATGQYYLHQFLPEQPEFNWRNPELREAMMEVLRFWLERGVDGFRMDVVWLILKDPAFRDNPPDPAADPQRPAGDIFGGQLHVYNQDRDEVQEIIQEFRRLLDSYGERCGVGEIYLDLPRWTRYYGTVGDGLHLPFNFRLISTPWQASAIGRSVDELEAALPSLAWPNYVLGNHDQPRLASRVGAAQARIGAMLLLTLRGTPTLYYGDELGMENGVIPPHKLQDPPGLNLAPERSRDVSRTPMQWNDGIYAGFSSVEPWLPISADYLARNVATQSADPSSMLTLYRRLIWYRKVSPALQGGDYHSLKVNDDCYVYLRSTEDERLMVALNFSDAMCQLTIPDLARGRVVLSTFLDREGEKALPELVLRPNEGVIIELLRMEKC